MFSYPRHIFSKFPVHKQLKHLTKQIDIAEKEYNTKQGKEALENIKLILSWIDNNSPLHNTIHSAFEDFSPNIDYNAFLKMVTKLESKTGTGKKDSDFLVIKDDTTKPRLPQAPIQIICHNLRSIFNVGSIFRTTEFFNLQKIWLTGYSPLPNHKKNIRPAMGCEEYVEWEQNNNLPKLINTLKNNGVTVIALETAEKSTSLSNYKADFPVAIILGNEKYGIEFEILSLCNNIISIPSYGRKNSLNVAGAFSAAAYELRRQFDRISS